MEAGFRDPDTCVAGSTGLRSVCERVVGQESSIVWPLDYRPTSKMVAVSLRTRDEKEGRTDCRQRHETWNGSPPDPDLIFLSFSAQTVLHLFYASKYPKTGELSESPTTLTGRPDPSVLQICKWLADGICFSGAVLPADQIPVRKEQLSPAGTGHASTQLHLIVARVLSTSRWVWSLM